MKTTILPTTPTKNRTEPKFKSARGVTGQLLSWASMNRPPWRHGFVLIPFVLACFALSPSARAADGGLPNQNTAEGTGALSSLTSGANNTAVGFDALLSLTDGSQDTATGSLALANDTGGNNTAFGFSALNANTTGQFNTATGRNALFTNITGISNTATGSAALGSNTTGSNNTATGRNALIGNTTGSFNTATGRNALFSNTTGSENTATGSVALNDNTTGFDNTATGRGALGSNTEGSGNTATGLNALLSNTTGSGNIALGDSAGTNLTTGDNNIDIGNVGVAGESNIIRIGTQGTQNGTFIAGISGSVVGNSVPVRANANGQLGTAPSSVRFKQNIKPMSRDSEAILALKPVTFRYKHELDPEGIPQFGLVAEEVEKVNPDLVARDDHGKPFTVRYEAVNAMLLNEFLKEHKKVEEQQATIAELKSTAAEQRKDLAAISAQQHTEIQALTASLKEQASQIQKMNAQMEIGKFTTGRIRRSGHAPQIVVTNP